MVKGALRATRTVVLIAAFLIFAALVWWVGPDIRIGDSQPLAPPGWRIAVIAIIPLLLLLPLLGAALVWSWRQLLPRRTPAEPDMVEPVCRDLLRQLRAHRPDAHSGAPERGQGDGKGARGWIVDRLRRAWPWFAPDGLIVAQGDAAIALQRHWPWDMEGVCGHPLAGDGFWSAGRCWLIVSPAQLVGWARALRWRSSPRAALWLVESGEWSVGQRDPALDAMRGALRGWRDVTGRKLPLWLGVWTQAGPALQAAWSPATDELPRGFTVPVRGTRAGAEWDGLVADYRAILESTLTEPDLPADAALARMRILQQCDTQLRAAPEALRQIGVGHDAFATATLRGLFWLWENGRTCIGLSGLLHVLVADRPAPRYCFRLAVARGVALLLLIGGFALLADEIVIEAPARHDQALANWQIRRSDVHRAAMQVVVAEPGTPVEPALDLLTAVEDAQAQAESTIGGAVPAGAAAKMAVLEQELWRTRLLVALLDWNRTCLLLPEGREGEARSGAMRGPPAAPTPSDYYRALATTLLLTGTQPIDEAFLRDSLSRCGAAPERIDAILHQVLRQHGRGATGLRPVDRAEIAAWRSALTGPARYTLADRLWDGMRHEMRSPTSVDFDFATVMGPGAFWFSDAPTVPWLFTADGLQGGYRAGHAHFADWAEEYRWVMAISGKGDDADMTTLDGVLRTRYAREAATAWEDLFGTLRLAPVRGIGEAVDRAQTFGSDASPFIQLLNVFEQAMPLPARKTNSLWSRMTTRMSNDWARLQYELGWRNSPRAAPQTNDPSYALAQRFAPLRSFFPDDKDKAPARDRLLQTLQPIGRYLGRQQAAIEFGGRPPPPASLAMLRVQAARLPAPLRGLVQDLADDSGRALGHEQLTALTLRLDAIPSYLACQLDAPFPLNRQGSTALDWGSFLQDFAPNGRIAGIVADHADLIDTSRVPWRLRLPPGAKGTPAMRARLAWLQRATRISQAWFPTTGSTMQFTLRSLYLGDDVLQARLVIDGQSWTYAHGPTDSVTIRWPGPAGSETVDLELQGTDGRVFHRHYAGPWALLALVRDSERGAMRSASSLALRLGGAQGRWIISVTSAGPFNPLDLRLYRGLCPGRGRDDGIDLYTPMAAPSSSTSGQRMPESDADVPAAE